MLRSNTNILNIDPSNKNRKNHLQMESDEETDPEDPLQADLEDNLCDEFDLIHSSSVKILTLQETIRLTMKEVEKVESNCMDLEIMNRSRGARGSQSSLREREEKAKRLTENIMKVVDDAMEGDPDKLALPEPIQDKALPKLVLNSKIALNISELNSVLLSQRLKTDGSVNPALLNFISRGIRKDGGKRGKQKKVKFARQVCEADRLIGYALCIQKGILPVVINSLSKASKPHHPLCPQVGEKSSNLIWFSVTEQEAKSLEDTCACLKHSHTLETMCIVPDANFLVSMELDGLPGKFPRNCSMQGLESEIMVSKNYVCATFLELLGQTTGDQSREAVSDHLVEVVNLAFQAQKSLATHEDMGFVSSTSLDVVRLAHVNKDHKKSGWMGVMGGKLHDEVKTTSPSFEDRLNLIKGAIRNLVEHSDTSSFFQNCGEIEFAYPESGEFV